MASFEVPVDLVQVFYCPREDIFLFQMFCTDRDQGGSRFVQGKQPALKN